MKNIEKLFDLMWEDYIKMNPQAQKIVDLLEAKGEKVVNDHIALRTYNIDRVSIDEIAKPFLEAGYEEKGTYDFEEKKLFAKHFEFPGNKLPKVFISELLIENFSEKAQTIMREKIAQLTDEQIADPEFMVSGKSWEISSQEYELLASESEYAAWVAAIGFRPNHFTVFINDLKNFNDVPELNTFLKENGFKLNDSGGEVKGSKEVCLEQSSTLADSIEVEFSDKRMKIASCYFEFAKRYPLESGDLYQGFVANSADKIFESTNRTQ